MSAGTSISQVMGDIGVPRELSGFPATNMLETPEIYELHSEVFGVDKAVALELNSIEKDDKMEEEAISPMAAETQAEPGQSQEV
ncbi:hypothetical protein G6F42_025741 [Rhizopus arrhizus]|nr:hypothetical protein G6F42_025741 [Rhizopus arrhizus]